MTANHTPTILRGFGVGLILIGLVAAFYGPLEFYVFYFFSEGGRFHYDGFGIVSLWFAALVAQNIGYYAVAAVCIPVGIARMTLRRWGLTLTRLYIWFWFGGGVILVVNIVQFISAALRLELSQEVLLGRLLIVCVLSVLFFIALPLLALWINGSENIRSTFAAYDPKAYWIERYPFPLLALLLVYLVMIIVLHVAITFQGFFPLFGSVVLGRTPVNLLSLCILILGILIYGILKLEIWAWWISLFYLTSLTISVLMTFSRYRFYDMILMMNLPAYEMALMDKLPLIHDYHLTALFGLPLLVALGLIVYSKRYFGTMTNPV